MIYIFLLLLIGVFLSIMTKKTSFLLFSLFILLTGLSNKLLHLYKVGKNWSKRPCQDTQCISCKPTWGFPSGHAQVFVMVSVFLSIYIIRKEITYSNLLLLLFLWLFAISICYQRYASKCHTVFQISIGALVGIVLGIIFYIIANKVDPSVFI